MPELPEVETTLRGIKPYLNHQTIINVIVRHHQLRWKIPDNLSQQLKNKKIIDITRRGKYLLFHMKKNTLILHLGMSGSLRLLMEPTLPKKHDHVDIVFANHYVLRFTDPRRFGAVLLTNDDPYHHPLLAKLGPEPLTRNFSGQYLAKKAQKRNLPIKSFIMNSHIVVGVGNIYATETLYLAGIHPLTPTQTLTQIQFKKLVKAIKFILKFAIKQGGTTLKDFINSDGKPGYFINKLQVYGRAGLPCLTCLTILVSIRIGQRATVYCSKCQPENFRIYQKN
jgi:formamidopyrimidine-DNA glycosylase